MTHSKTVSDTLFISQKQCLLLAIAVEVKLIGNCVCSIIASLPVATQQFVALLFGTWFRVVNHCEYNAMTSEALAKSVAGSIFHTCAAEPAMVSNAVQLMRLIIDNFGQPAMLGHANIQYFTERTSTAIKVCEKYKYRLSGRCPLTTVDDTNDTLRVECGM